MPTRTIFSAMTGRCSPICCGRASASPCFLIPILLLAWSFRLMLHRPLRSIWARLALLPVSWCSGRWRFRSSISERSLRRRVPAAPSDGGCSGCWSRAGLGTAALPISMAAAAVAGLLLLATMGLSLRDWREIGEGAGRGATRLAGFPARARMRRDWLARPGTGAGRRELAAAATREADRHSDASQVATRPSSRRCPAGASLASAHGQPAQSATEAGSFASSRRKRGRSRKESVPEQERQPALDLEPDRQPVLPSLDLLAKPQAAKTEAINEEALEKNARLLETVLEDFGVRGQIVQVRPGPVVTLYELEPAPGIKASRIIGLADDIARSMSAISVRVAVVSGRNVIGIELPNRKAETVFLRELLDSPVYENHPGRLALILGKDISGEPVLADLAKMPHLLIAGTTGSGKSVGINTMILSILYRMPPDRCKFIMVDPKMLELSVYDGIPHLLAPVVTDPRKAVLALKWTVREMENRYRKMSKLGVRNIDGFNARLAEAEAKGESLIRKVQTGFRSAKPVSRFSSRSRSTPANCR